MWTVFFLFPVMEDMLTVGPHYLRLHNLKSTSGLIKNSCSVGITSEKFCVHKNNLWSIIPSPPAPRLMCIFSLGLWCFDVVPPVFARKLTDIFSFLFFLSSAGKFKKCIWTYKCCSEGDWMFWVWLKKMESDSNCILQSIKLHMCIIWYWYCIFACCTCSVHVLYMIFDLITTFFIVKLHSEWKAKVEFHRTGRLLS